MGPSRLYPYPSKQIRIVHDCLGFLFANKLDLSLKIRILWPKSTGGPSDDLGRSFGIIFSSKFQNPTILVNKSHICLYLFVF